MTQSSNIAVALGVLLLLSGCKKKEPKPVHTEPWLAHPPASAAVSPEAGIVTTHYVLTQQSVIRFELPTKRGKVRGKLSQVSGDLSLALGALAQSRGLVRARLDSLSLDDGVGAGESATWLARAKSALGIALGDGGVDTAAAVASYEITSLSEVSPEALEPGRASDGGAPVTRHARGIGAGNLLLNGFRVAKRSALEAELGFVGDAAAPATLVIRSRTPLVISLETHEIRLHEPAAGGADRRHKSPSASAHDVRVSVELYATKD